MVKNHNLKNSENKNVENVVRKNVPKSNLYDLTKVDFNVLILKMTSSIKKH